MKAERIEELRVWALALITGPRTCHLARRDCPWPEATPEIRADLLILLDEKAEQIKAGATMDEGSIGAIESARELVSPGPSPELKQVVDYITRPLFGMEWVDSLLRACHTLNEGKPDHQKWIDEARAIIKAKPAPLPAEVRKAEEFLGFWVDFLKLPGLDKELDPYVWDEHDEAALAVIRAALTSKR